MTRFLPVKPMIPKETAEAFRNKNCLVTGGTGLIGRQVVKLLADQGDE